MKAATVLAVILVIIISGNFFMRERFSSLDKTMTSMYDDRLKVSAYIYEISNHLYQKRLIQTDDYLVETSRVAEEVQQHDSAILSLMTQYETTYLTANEEKQWEAFKAHLIAYNQTDDVQGSQNSNAEALLSRRFDQVLQDLNALSSIQIEEGSQLRNDTHSIVSHSLILSILEIALLIVLGLFTLVILSATDNRIFKQVQEDVRLN